MESWYRCGMAIRKLQVALHGDSNLPQDDAVNVLYFDTEELETAMDGVAAAYNAAAGIFNEFFVGNGMTIKAYEPTGGQPLQAKDYAFSPISAGDGPTEVAICLSYASVDDPDASTGRRRGRIYLPVGGQTTLRPSATVIDRVLDLGEALAQVGFANATTWHLWSATDQTSAKIESIWCDDAWDTQRRRGLDPTMREVRDVQ